MTDLDTSPPSTEDAPPSAAVGPQAHHFKPQPEYDRPTPGPREFIFLRHAQSEGNCGTSDHCDCDLTDAGRLQARNAGFALRRQFDLRGFRGVTSPYRRARETAKLLGGTAAIPFDVNPLVREWGKDCVIDDTPYPEESLSVAAGRVSDFIRMVPPGGKVIVVSHATPIFLMVHLLTLGNVAHALSRCTGEFWKTVTNCGATHVRGNQLLCFSKRIV